MNVYYFVHITGTDLKLSGIPRVVRNLASALLKRSDVDVIPVVWSVPKHGIVHAPQGHLDNLARDGGPLLASKGTGAIASAEGWLLVSEVPHLQSHDPDFPSVAIGDLIGSARRCGLQVAAILHDLLPLTHGELLSGRSNRTQDLSSPGALADELARTRFENYALSLASVDRVLPVSRTTMEAFRNWLLEHGVTPGRLPATNPIQLPEEVIAGRRLLPNLACLSQPGPIEFLSVGTLSHHKNQLAAMQAFHRLAARRTDLDLRLHVVGHTSPSCAVSASSIARRSGGKIILHGFLQEAELRDLWRRSRASVFVSQAEGFGLPVAESLWYGRPCICSNTGSLAEIADAGGCLTVDPGSAAEIEAAFERLATDLDFYLDRLRAIAARRFKMWDEYAEDIIRALRLEVGAAAAGAEFSDQQAALPESSLGARFELDLVALRISDNSGASMAINPTSRDVELSYHDAETVGVTGKALFYGPYYRLGPGRYSFHFQGELHGAVSVGFTSEGGATTWKSADLSIFDDVITFDITRDVSQFEIVIRTGGPATTVKLNRILVDFTPGAPKDDSNVIVLDDGIAVALPYFFPATSFAIPDGEAGVAAQVARSGQSLVLDTTAAQAGKVQTLFFGPYAHLPAGRYTFTLRGTLDGRIALRFTRDFGAKTFYALQVDAFDQPIVVNITETAHKFEIVAATTEAACIMRLDGIHVDRIGEPVLPILAALGRLIKATIR
jgi:glycosyltransferase involved in cell wall biosynthesis